MTAAARAAETNPNIARLCSLPKDGFVAVQQLGLHCGTSAAAGLAGDGFTPTD